MTILSSREHTCIHEEVIGEPKKNEKCKELIKGKKDKTTGEIIPSSQCSYYHLWKKTDDNDFMDDNCWDIEDLINESKDRGYCPFYVSRDIAKQVDIVFCPYNYLIDPSIRSSMKLSLKNEIVILDEAHNIEDSCRASTTFQTHMVEIDTIQSELTQALDLTTQNEYLQVTLGYLLTFVSKFSSLKINYEIKSWTLSLTNLNFG
jgi:fanconi anemia group J protein